MAAVYERSDGSKLALLSTRAWRGGGAPQLSATRAGRNKLRAHVHVLTFIEALGEARLKAAQCACTVQVCRENSKTVVGSLSETDAANEFSIRLYLFPPERLATFPHVDVLVTP